MNKLEQVDYAFGIERASYQRTIRMLEEELRNNPKETEYKALYETALETIEELTARNNGLMTELECAYNKLKTKTNKLSAKQYEEYKRLKRNEYQRRWYKKDKKKSAK